MKNMITFLGFAFILLSCNPVKNIYSSDDVNERQLDKLVKNYLKHPGDTAYANRVVYAYNIRHNEQLDRIQRLQQSNSLSGLEQLVREYDELQSLYNAANQYAAIRELVHPGNVASERQQAAENAAAAWYDEADRLLATNHWRAGREAIQMLGKVNNWIPGYRDSRRMQQAANELATIDAVIEPLRTEGFFYSSGHSNTGSRLTRQLIADLGNRWTNNNRYRVYDSREAHYNQVQADWLIEPVITRMQIDPVHYTRTTRTVTKTIETGKDSLKNPVHKTIRAVLTITEASVCASTNLEARISDLQTNERIDRRNFTENFTLRELSASYTGDKNALSSEDWQLVNNRNNIRIDERWLQEKLLEQVYPNLLEYLKRMLR